MVSIGNPLISGIPQPQKDREEVFNPLFPNRNVGAPVVTQQINRIFSTVLETHDTETATYDTTAEIILTELIIQGLAQGGSATVTATYDIYIGELHIFSANFKINSTQDREFSYVIPFQHVRILSNERIKVVQVDSDPATSDLDMNAIFVGYYPTKL